MTEENKQDKLLEQLGQLFQKSVDANRRLVEEASQTTFKLFSSNSALSDFRKLNEDIVEDALNNWLKLSIAYSEQILDLSLKTAEQLKSVRDSNEEVAVAESVHQEEERTAVYEAPPQKPVLQLAGKPGETVIASFMLNSSNEERQKGAFSNRQFKSEASGRRSGIKMSFEPSTFELEPGQGVKIDVYASIPKSAKEGFYSSAVTIDGFPESAFDVQVEVV